MRYQYNFLTGNYFTIPCRHDEDYEPDFIELADGDMDLAECMADYHAYCYPWRMGYRSDRLIEFDDFKDDWYAEREIEHAA